jgi:hypothetical protein
MERAEVEGRPVTSEWGSLFVGFGVIAFFCTTLARALYSGPDGTAGQRETQRVLRQVLRELAAGSDR